MKKHLLKRVLSMLLVVALLVGSYAPGVRAASIGFSWKETDRKTEPDMSARKVETIAQDTYAPTDMVRVSIILEDKPTVQAGFATQNIARNNQAMAYSRQLRVKQNAVAQTISAQALSGQKLDVVWNLTLVGNIISANVPYGKIPAIAAVNGVKKVIVENSYQPCVVEREESVAEPRMYAALGMVGSSLVWSTGFTGAGSRIAVIDTGTDINHQSLDNGAFLYALKQNAAARGISYDKYVNSLNLLDEQEIASVLRDLNIYERNGSLTASQLYLSEKLPFAVNYVDRNLVVDHMSDYQGGHGSHVAGIAAANRYIPQGSGYAEAMNSVMMAGTAPDAQLITMKVFGNAAGPYDSDYMSAVEDAIVLGCDAVNLSLGSGNAGDGFDPYFSELLDYMTQTDTVVVASCGNSSSWADATYYGYLYSDDVSLDTVGSPGSYGNFFTVASVENSGGVVAGMEVAGNTLSYSDSGYQGFCDLLSSLDTSADGSGTEYEYILIEGIGNVEDYAGIDLTGKIVFCSRGTLNFAEKANNAVSLGAAAVVIYNNDSSGLFNMNMTGYNFRNPCVAISREDAQMIISASLRNTSISGVRYYEGTVTVREESTYLMSNFSSWGVPGDLSLKPEITAPGGNIYSLYGKSVYGGGHDQYEIMSGTSMAAPAVTGMVALMAQYLRENGLAEQENMHARTLAQSLLMSTAVPIREENSGDEYYSLMKQGAGLARVDLAAAADSYILVEGQADGKVKVELGDDPNRTGVYEFSFSINNLSGQQEGYVLSADVFCQDQFEYQPGTGVFLLDTWTTDLSAAAAFKVNGREVAAGADLSRYDLNGDGTTNTSDADYLLEYLLGNVSPLCGEGDVNGDGQVCTYDAHVLLAKLGSSGGFVTVPANGSVTVDVKLTLTPESKAKLDAYYDNGTYVEAFVYAKSVPGAAGEAATTHSIPVLGFYGNWTDASMFERGSAVENAYDNSGTVPYLSRLSNYFGNTLTVDYGDGEEYYFGGNPFVDDAEYLPERNAFNSENGSVLKTQYATLIRKPGDAHIQVANADTGKVYMEKSLGGLLYAYYNVNSGSWQDVRQRIDLNWGGKDASGHSLPEGTNVEVTLAAAPEYYRNADGRYDYDSLGQGAYMTTRFTIDNTAPEIMNVELAGNSLRVTARDNQYVAAVVLVSVAGSSVITAVSPNQTQKNTDISVDLDLSRAFGKNFVVEVYDYAGNYTTYEVTLDVQPVDRPRFTVVDYQNATYYGLDENGNVMPLITSDRGTVNAVEFVDGYIFEITENRNLYVAPDDDLYNFTYLRDIDPDDSYGITQFLDLAFNYRDGKLYGLFDSYPNWDYPMLCTIDTADGTMEIVGNLPLDGENLAIDDAGNFYSTASRSQVLYTYTLADVKAGCATHLMTRYSDLTSSLTSLAWDHDEDVLYQAFPNKLLKIDFDNMTVTRVQTNAIPEMVGLYIRPETWGDRFAPVNRVTSVTIDKTESRTLVDESIVLKTQVWPWNTSDSSVTWTSSKPSVATVDQNGVVTGVSVGTAVITATSRLNPTKSASCTVQVISLDKQIHAFLIDEAGDTWWSTFNPATIPRLNKVAMAENNSPFCAATMVGDTLYAAVEYPYSLYTVDPDTFEQTMVGYANVPYYDLAYAPSLGYLLAVYSNYVLLVDMDSGDYMSAWDWCEGVAADVVGITYYGTEYSDLEETYLDYFLLLDADGNVYLEAFGGDDYDVGYYNGPQYGYLTNIGEAIDVVYYQGFHYDGECAYWTRYNEADSEVELIVWDCDNSGAAFRMGAFPKGVWPISGLYTDSETRTVGPLCSSLSQKEIRTDSVLTEVEVKEIVTKPAGGPHAVAGDVAATLSSGKYEKEEAYITLELTNVSTAPNGWMTVTYDPAVMTFGGIEEHTEAFAYTVENGRITVAFAAATELPENTVVAALTFIPVKSGEHTITITHIEAWDEPCGKQEFVIVDCGCDHSYEAVVTEPTCQAQGYTTYTCSGCGDSYVADYTGSVDHSYENGACKWCGEAAKDYSITWVEAYSSLGGNIAVVFKAELSKDLAEDPNAFMRFTYAGKTVEIPVSEATKSGKYHNFYCRIASINMTDDITAQMMVGEEAIGRSVTTSLEKYCSYILSTSKDAKTLNLMKAMLNYGAAAQKMMKYKLDNLANKGLSEADKALTAVDASGFKHNLTGSEAGIKAAEAMLVLGSETTIRIGFTLTGNKTIDEYTFTVDGVEVKPVYKGGMYRLEVPNIAAHKLDEYHTFTCGDITITYCGLSYVNQIMKSYTEGTTFDMAVALYNYSQATEAFIS